MNWCNIRNKYHLVPSVSGYQFKARDIFVSLNVWPLLPVGEIVSLHGDIQCFLKENVNGNKKKTNWNNLIVNCEKNTGNLRLRPISFNEQRKIMCTNKTEKNNAWWHFPLLFWRVNGFLSEMANRNQTNMLRSNLDINLSVSPLIHICLHSYPFKLFLGQIKAVSFTRYLVLRIMNFNFISKFVLTCDYGIYVWAIRNLLHSCNCPIERAIPGNHLKIHRKNLWWVLSKQAMVCKNCFNIKCIIVIKDIHMWFDTVISNKSWSWYGW